MGERQHAPGWEPGDDSGLYEQDSVARVLSAWDAATLDPSVPDPRATEPKQPIGLVTLRDIAWRKAQRVQRERVPTGFCPECWVKWNKALLSGRCVCTGHVDLIFQIPA